MGEDPSDRVSTIDEEYRVDRGQDLYDQIVQYAAITSQTRSWKIFVVHGRRVRDDL